MANSDNRLDGSSAMQVSEDPRGEFPFAPPEYLFLVLISIVRYRDANLEKLLRPLDISLTRYRALLVIGRFEPCTMTELADFSIVERTTMTRTVDQLVAAGWIDRAARRAGADRRQVVLTLTSDGRAKVKQVAEVIARQNLADLEGIEDETQRTLIRLAQGLVANLAPDAATRERLLTFRRPEKTSDDPA